jgi:hypothetical protein
VEQCRPTGRHHFTGGRHLVTSAITDGTLSSSRGKPEHRCAGITVQRDTPTGTPLLARGIPRLVWNSSLLPFYVACESVPQRRISVLVSSYRLICVYVLTLQGLHTKYCIHFSFLPHTLHVRFRTVHSPPDDSWTVWTVNPLTAHLFQHPTFCSTPSRQHPVLWHNLYFSLDLTDRVLHAYRKRESSFLWLRKIYFGPITRSNMGMDGTSTTRTFMLRTPHQVSLGWSNQEEWAGQGM